MRIVALALCVSLLGTAGCPKRNDDHERTRTDSVRIEAVTPRAATGDVVEHTLSIPEPASHYIEMRSVFTTGGAEQLTVAMAVWTPGSYLVREYSRHIEGISAATTDAKPLRIAKVRKNRWKVTTNGADRVVIRYRLYAFEMTVRTNFVDADVAVINGAATFLVEPDKLDRAHDLQLDLGDTYPAVETGMPAHPSGDPRRYLAPDFDTLVDCPIVAGTANVGRFDIEKIPHALASFGESNIWDGKRAAEDVEQLARIQVAFWGVIPYQRYVFLNVLYQGGGGLEHKNSTLMMTNPFMTRKRATYLRWLGLVSHEFFHTWNVKRLRPVELGPFDYENEVHTKSLWIAEGITSYYDDLLLVRAGLMSQEEYFETLSRQIEAVERVPGRKVQSLAMASYDAWIKYYRRNANSPNSQVSYYRKGAVVGFLLDAAIRKSSFGKRSLDDVMRKAYAKFSGKKGFTTAEFRALVSEVANKDMSSFFTRYIDGTDALDYEPALAFYGLHFEPQESDDNLEDKKKTPDETPGWLGLEVRADNQRLIVAGVPRETPAYQAGFNVNDEILAIDGFRVLGDLDQRLELYRPGQTIKVMINRRKRVRTLTVKLIKKPEKSYNVAVALEPSGAQRRRLERWLQVPNK